MSPVVAALYQTEWMLASEWSLHEPEVFFLFAPETPGTAAAEQTPSLQSHRSSF